MRHYVVSLVLAVYSFSLSTFGVPIDWDPSKRSPIRDQLTGCHVFLSPPEPAVNDSVGVRLSSNRLEDFEVHIAEAVRDRGRDALKGSHLFVTGVAMQDEIATRSAFEAVLEKSGFQPNDIRVRVMSVPTANVKKISKKAFRHIYERLSYFFPSMARDYQTPLRDEVISGLVSAAMVEVINVVYLYKALPTMDAHLTVALHATLLVLYSVYKKFMCNWLLRPGSNHVESFLKQISLSFPFVANYNIFGNFSQIVAFYQEHGWEAVAARFPAEVANFATTQGMTLFLQTLFYNFVISSGVRGWENRQVGAARSLSARTVSNWITVPILAVDAVFLAMAASNTQSLVQWGPLDINAGHAGLALMTVLGSALWVWPKALDPVLDWYESVKGFFARFGGFLSSSSQGKPPGSRGDE